MNTIRRIRSLVSRWFAPTPDADTAECVCCHTAMDETLPPDVPQVCFDCWVCCSPHGHNPDVQTTH
ncbi:hypothetical protein LX15_001147 [Streptoalloteichus tenebrarius]|uniref:Uncharacterized protein n=1 Tax=Streptoalloteichus tenebrarius (strain ATCC 17920 / DSM 40477 / JCM 4838 / CBS 697.72 / NBRC 16177 / NCIMB 11028 / NRRL B-12390 / A12253. 1 / ISP 5477) TaxID=1933 RepID=A0ABT1HPM5_STRSD|nr:hypothetical protein [Streptoalloteichus tenebrarius]MCP2257462.1 hypothetical protein [Streptoalloteichus tenebrarius]BFE98411.1 hypothetical protein GCM10020241_00870 [Streptoalloteichus tenebrarius]